VRCEGGDAKGAVQGTVKGKAILRAVCADFDDCWFALTPAARAEKAQVNTLNDLFDRLSACWKPPPASVANPMDITVSVSFNRAGQILGRPRITFESAEATDNDRVAYRIGVMETLQRCTPMPFTETMDGAVAGRPFKVEFRTLKPPSPTEKKHG